MVDEQHVSSAEWPMTNADRSYPKTQRRASVFIVIALLLWAVPAYYLWKSNLNIPWGDEWYFLAFVEKSLLGQWHFADLLQRYNGHTYLAFRLIFWASAAWDHLNLIHLKELNLLIMGGVAYLLSRLAAESNPSPAIPVVFALIMAFSLRQWESLSWSMLVVQYLTLLLFLGALHCFLRRNWALATCLLVILPLLTGNGVLAIIAFSMAFLLLKLPKPFLAAKGSWLFSSILGLASFALFFLMARSVSPWEVLKYIILMMGGAYTDILVHPRLIYLLGSVNLMLHIYSMYLFTRSLAKGKSGRTEFALAVLVIFSILNVSAAICSRLLVGVNQPDASRYFLFTAMGTVAAFSNLCRHAGASKLIALPLFLVTVATIFSYDYYMLKAAPYHREFGCKSYAYLVKNLNRAEFYKSGMPDFMFDWVELGLGIIKKQKLSFFYSPPQCDTDDKS